jgi:hypothetical protein
MLLLWNHNSKHINVNFYFGRYIELIAVYSWSLSDVFASFSLLILWRRTPTLNPSCTRRYRDETDSSQAGQCALSCALCQPVARSRLRGGEAGWPLRCRGVCTGRYCAALHRMLVVDAVAIRPSSGWCSGAERGSSWYVEPGYCSLDQEY